MYKTQNKHVKMGYTIEQVKKIIKDLVGHNVVSKEYIGHKQLLDVECVCGVIYQKTMQSIRDGYYHCNGKKQRSKRIPTKEIKCNNPECNNIFKQRLSRDKYCSMKCSKVITHTQEYKDKMSKLKTVLNPKICEMCKNDFQPKRFITRFCSKKCDDDHKRTDELREKAKLNGQKGGKRSAHSQQRRSKNEVLFAEMCEAWFGKENVLCNEPMFEGWDADVIIPSKKVAILWNGAFHYKQIMQSQSLAQVQARDKVKTTIIKKQGYVPYEIKDMGKHNPKFVAQEFECFLFSLISPMDG